MYLLLIDYDEPNSKSYRGVVIYDSSVEPWKELVRVNTGSPAEDEETALERIFDVIDEEECEISYMSSYDHYFMDYDYENNPETKAEVDRMNKEQDDKIEKYKKEIGKGEDDELTIEEWNYIINRRDVKNE